MWRHNNHVLSHTKFLFSFLSSFRSFFLFARKTPPLFHNVTRSFLLDVIFVILRVLSLSPSRSAQHKSGSRSQQVQATLRLSYPFEGVRSSLGVYVSRKDHMKDKHKRTTTYNIEVATFQLPTSRPKYHPFILVVVTLFSLLLFLFLFFTFSLYPSRYFILEISRKGIERGHKLLI